jgi:hypothetical protein
MGTDWPLADHLAVLPWGERGEYSQIIQRFFADEAGLRRKGHFGVSALKDLGKYYGFAFPAPN